MPMWKKFLIPSKRLMEPSKDKEALFSYTILH